MGNEFLMSWIKHNKYYLKCNEWTICKYGPPHFEYALWKNNINKGFFMTSQEAKIKYELIKND